MYINLNSGVCSPLLASVGERNYPLAHLAGTGWAGLMQPRVTCKNGLSKPVVLTYLGIGPFKPIIIPNKSQNPTYDKRK
jgi:hypothetical protein